MYAPYHFDTATPCAYYKAPGSETVCRFGVDSPDSGMRFVAVPWLGRWAERVEIPGISDCKTGLVLPTQSTEQSAYMRHVQHLIDQISATGGKTVYSRVICAPAAESVDGLAARLLDGVSTTCRAVFYVPGSGVWMVSSPELMLSVDADSASTVSLAGTRPAGSQEPWDEKNKAEQAMVTRFITQAFGRAGLKPTASETFTKQAGNVEHLCTEIKAHLPEDFCVSTLLDALAPTPALCGDPRDESIRRIAAREAHSRGFYGGYFGVTDGRRMCLHVMVRCAALDPDSNTGVVYAGGGITAQSRAEAEWAETALKARTMENILFNNNTTNG